MALKYKLNLRPSLKKKDEKKKPLCRPHLQHQVQETGTLIKLCSFATT